jgi:excisionase family DNA binding protein
MKKIVYQISDDQIKALAEKISANIRSTMQSTSKAPKLQDTFLDVTQLSNLLDLSVQTIYGLVHRNKIPYHKPGKKLYFLKSEIYAWVTNGRKKSCVSDQVDQFLSNKKSNKQP